jgi:hypothetical protein
LLCCAIVGVIVSCAKKKDEKQNEQEQARAALKKSREYCQELRERLNQLLTRHIETKGVAGAIEPYSEEAKTVLHAFELDNGVTVRRVSVKPRNPENEADKYEQKALRKFEEMKTLGKPDVNIEQYEIIVGDTIKYLQYVQPIFVEQKCLNCHDTPDKLQSDVQTALKTKFPKDMATGYRVGELRGAISLKVPL